MMPEAQAPAPWMPTLPRRALLLARLQQADGPPLSTGDIAIILGVDARTVRREILEGEIRREGIITLSRGQYRITVPEARRYLVRLGALTETPRADI